MIPLWWWVFLKGSGFQTWPCIRITWGTCLKRGFQSLPLKVEVELCGVHFYKTSQLTLMGSRAGESRLIRRVQSSEPGLLSTPENLAVE